MIMYSRRHGHAYGGQAKLVKAAGLNLGRETLNNMKKHFVYILQSVKDKNFYTGLSNNIDRRIREHQLGLVKSTKNRRPLKLIHLETFGSKKEAAKREKFLKSGQGREILKKLKLK